MHYNKMSTNTIYKVAFFGNSGVGKSKFLQLISDNSSLNDMESKVQFVKRKILGIDYTIQTTELGGIMKAYDQQTWKNKISLLGQVDLVVIFFDVSNSQSFLDVGRFWLPRIRQSVKTKKTVLLANKIDKPMVQTMYNMIDFSILNGSKLFYSSSKLKCKQIFDQIILYHDNQMIQQKIVSDRPKKQNFLSKIFGGKNESEDLKQRKQELKKIMEERIYQLKKSFEERSKQIQQQARSRELKYVEMVNKIGNSISSKWVGNGQNLEEKLESLNQKLMKLKRDWQQSSIQQLNKISQFQQQLKTAIVNDKQKSELQEELSKLKSESNQYKEQALKLNDQIRCLREAFSKQKLDLLKQLEKLSRQKQILQKRSLQQKNQIMQQTKTKLTINQKKQPQYSDIFYHQSFRKIQKNNLQEICNHINTIQNMKLSHFILVYRFDLCLNNSFHDFIDKKSNLFFLITIEDAHIIFYITQKFMSNKSSRGLIMLLKKGKGLKNFQLNQNVSIFKYDPLVLSFSKGEIQIKFTKENCLLMLRNKKESVFMETININELLQLPDKESGSYQISLLEIYQIQF